ncbi:N/A [soil metagenome]
MDAKFKEPLMDGCRWIAAPAEGRDRGVETWDLATLVGFKTLRVFWLTNIAEGQWRGRHAHRESTLATFAVAGSCRLTLDNGDAKQVVELRDDGPGLIVGPWIWHDLFDFSPGCVIVVAASTRYDEAEYIRDYDAFLREAKARH